MIVSVASGKGGTGKTTVSASLAQVWRRPVLAVDLDVEEPNLHLFLHPQISWRASAFMEIPVVDRSACTLCRKCSELCQFKAISVMGKLLLTFSEMCHGCGGCLAVCAEGALKPGKRELGVIEGGRMRNGQFMSGRLRVGEAMSPPLMREVKRHLGVRLLESGMDAILDCPPGVSCPAVNAVMDSDAIVLVTEPTPFGFHDFVLAVEAFSPLNIPMGAVINRAGLGDGSVRRFCADNAIPVLCEIPYRRAIAEEYASGGVLAAMNPEMEGLFAALRDNVASLCGEAAHA